MRNMYQKAGLVHGDLSEYNMLYQKGLLYFIDVSQSVEEDHPRALDFLRMDCKNVTDFFRKVRPELSKKEKAERDAALDGVVGGGGGGGGGLEGGVGEDGGEEVKVEVDAAGNSTVQIDSIAISNREKMGRARLEPLSVVELFNFITDKALEDEDVDEYLDNAADSGGTTSEQTAQDKVDEAVFMKAFIPRSLGQVHDFEKEHSKVMQGQGESVYVNSVADLVGGGGGNDVGGADSKMTGRAGGDGERKGGADGEEGQGEGDNPEGFTDEYLRKKEERMRKKDLKKQGLLVAAVGSAEFEVKSTKDKALKREHKRLVKLEKAEKRKKKIPKHIKKKAMKGKAVKGKKSR
jgi:RIO kinase 1